MSTKSKGKSVPSHAQAMQRALRAIGAWEAHDENTRADHARGMRLLLSDAAGDRTGNVTLDALDGLFEDCYALLHASGQPGLTVIQALHELASAAHRLSGAFGRDLLARVRVTIDVDVPAPTPDEMKDLKAIIDVEGPNLASEAFGTVFDTQHTFVSAKVAEAPIPPLNLPGSKRPLRQLPPLPPIPTDSSLLPKEEAWELVVTMTALCVELALRGDKADEVAVEDADNSLEYMRIVGLGAYADLLEQWLAEAV